MPISNIGIYIHTYPMPPKLIVTLETGQGRLSHDSQSGYWF